MREVTAATRGDMTRGYTTTGTSYRSARSRADYDNVGPLSLLGACDNPLVILATSRRDEAALFSASANFTVRGLFALLYELGATSSRRVASIDRTRLVVVLKKFIETAAYFRRAVVQRASLGSLFPCLLESGN